MMPNAYKFLQPRLTIHICLAFALCLTLIGGVTAAQSDVAPYIYYVHDLTESLIIERADGTDSRAIPLPFPADDNAFMMHGWSASGKWFAMSSYLDVEGTPYRLHTYLISTDGQDHLNLGESSVRVFAAHWSPVEDILLIAQGNVSSRGVNIRLFDVERRNNRGEARIEYETLEPPRLETVWWSSNGQLVIASWFDQILTMKINGESEQQSFDRSDRVSVDPSFDRGKLLLLQDMDADSMTLRVEDRLTRRFFDITDDITNVISFYSLRWSPTQDYALLVSRSCDGGYVCEWRWRRLDWDARQIVDLNLPTIFREQVEPCSSLYRCDFWSIDGRYAALVDDTRNLYVLDLESGRNRALGFANTYFWWLPDNTLLIYGDPYVIYDPATNELRSVNIETEYSVMEVFPSPSGRLIGLVDDPPTIVDLNGRIIAQSIPHSFSTASPPYPVRGYMWHSDEQWVMATYSISFAGGGAGPDASIVFNLNGTVRRELPVFGAASFLPESAIPHLAPGEPLSSKPDPSYILPQVGLVYGVVWHPTDPNRLVTLSRDSGLTLWSLEDGAVSITDEKMPEFVLPENITGWTDLQWLPDENTVVLLPADEPDEDFPLSLADGQIWTTDIGDRIAVAGGVYRCCIQVVNAETGELIDELYGTAMALALSLDERWLATTSNGMTAIWDMSRYTEGM